MKTCLLIRVVKIAHTPLIGQRGKARAVCRYWEKEGSALQERWGEFTRLSVPFLTRLVTLLLKVHRRPRARVWAGRRVPTRSAVVIKYIALWVYGMHMI